ncbi:hypothetical protein [Aurantibacillus circumpalustris]|uniref:hypothetical protein n=1 Tax=Aurantibacillus circumpalustris TaxID=3036359 RepID=UPI00295AD809|nr:hypothetical protein [Aurantibacillus circumpalustris]
MKNLINLNRFTTLPILLDFLEKQKLVLLDPISWEDKNDSEVILEYKRKAKIKSVFALCFTDSGETIHHWKTFAKGNNGCCIEFNANKLTEIFDKTPGIRHGNVNYKSINEEMQPFKLKDFPFIKRLPYKFEREYRVIWEGKSTKPYFEIKVPIEIIRRITFSQQMPESVFNTVKFNLIKNYPSLKNKINHSTIYRNELWINYFKK